MMVSAESIREALLALLKPSPTPLTVTELRVRLRVRAVKLAEYEVLRELRSLREEGLVRLERGRWSVVSPFSVAPFSSPTTFQPSNESIPRIRSVPMSPAPSRSSAIAGWSPSQSQILNNASLASEQVSSAAKPADFSGPWGTFHKLLGYYADCVRNDEGCEVSGFLQDCSERFIFLNQCGMWYPKAGQPWRLSLPSGPNLQPLVRKLALSGEDGVLDA
jgi:hypothetical protein